MPLIRVLNAIWYDHHLGRFSSLAFNPSSNGGISVFHKDCAIRTSGDVCSHIDRFYKSVSGEPPLFWELPEDLEKLCELDSDLSDTEDACHDDIINLKKNRARQLFKRYHKLGDIKICDDGNERSAIEKDFMNHIKRDMP